MKSESYAVFLSYNGEDREEVVIIAIYLADYADLRPWFDRWSLIPGEPWVRNLESGLEAASSCAVFVGKSGKGPWQKPEVEVALRQQVQNQDFRVIPVLLPDAPEQPELPMFLSGNTWVDFRKGLDDDDALWRLECGIRGKLPGRGRPQPTVEQQALQTPAPESIDVGRVDVEIATTESPAHVFISYRRQEPDSSLAHAFSDALKLAGHQVFIDTGIRWGANWVKEIREALERSDFLLVLLSQEAAASEMVVGEVTIAKELALRQDGVPVILPVRIRFPFTEPLPYHLSAHLLTVQQECWNGPDDTSHLVGQLLITVAGRTGWPDETPRETPSGSAQHIAPLPYFDPRDLITPGGALDVDSRFYILREADDEVFAEVHRPRGIVTIRGPRQTGKTSLIMRVYAAIRGAESQLRTAFVDFQALPNENLESLDTAWCSIAVHIAEQLPLEGWDATDWQLDGRHDRNFSRFLDYVFDESEIPLLICLDEVDRVFKSQVKSEFFSSVRAFYNRGAFDPSWKKVRWLLGTSSEPSFFIEDLTQSPFNLEPRVELSAFTPKEVAEFARRHGLRVADDTINNIMTYVGGRPYLVHSLLYHLVRKPESRDQLFDAQTAGGGVFRDHLHRYLMQFQQEEELAGAMKSVISGQGCKDVRMASRLEAAGLVCRDENQKVVPLCGLYAEFFRKELK